MVLTGPKTTPTEGGHWYKPGGEPCYEVPAANGNLRPTTLRDARKMGLLPSVTTIIRCAAAPGLEIWKQNQVLLAALTLPRQANESDESFCERILRDSQEQARKARDRGTDIHGAIQRHYENQPSDPALWDYVRGCADTIGANCGEQSWIPEKSFSSPLGYGGKVDLHSLQWVLDFKTKEFGKDDIHDLKTWDEHAMQLAAYGHGLGVPQARAGIVFVSTTVPGLCVLREIDQAELDRGFEMFRSLLTFWKARANYWPEAA